MRWSSRLEEEEEEEEDTEVSEVREPSWLACLVQPTPLVVLIVAGSLVASSSPVST